MNNTIIKNIILSSCIIEQKESISLIELRSLIVFIKKELYYLKNLEEYNKYGPIDLNISSLIEKFKELFHFDEQKKLIIVNQNNNIPEISDTVNNIIKEFYGH